MPFKHVASELLLVKRTRSIDGKTVEFEIEENVPRLEWYSETEDPMQSKPETLRENFKVTTSVLAGKELQFYNLQKARVEKRKARAEASVKLDELKERSNWTVAQCKEAILSIAKLLE